MSAFYNIVELTKQVDGLTDRIGAGQEDGRDLTVATLRIQLAQVQQLAVLSGHLGKLVRILTQQQAPAETPQTPAEKQQQQEQWRGGSEW